jgi:hypothetical protein
MSAFFKLIWIAFLVAACPVLASPVTQKLVGTLKDDSGGAIGGARILVHWDRSGADVGLSSNVGLPNDLTIQSDRTGRFEAELPSGFYDVFISATAFSPECRKIRLKMAETVRYDTKLKADPLVTKELGFTITAPK